MMRKKIIILNDYIEENLPKFKDIADEMQEYSELYVELDIMLR